MKKTISQIQELIMLLDNKVVLDKNDDLQVCDYFDGNGQWNKVKEITKDGVILINDSFMPFDNFTKKELKVIEDFLFECLADSVALV